MQMADIQIFYSKDQPSSVTEAVNLFHFLSKVGENFLKNWKIIKIYFPKRSSFEGFVTVWS